MLPGVSLRTCSGDPDPLSQDSRGLAIQGEGTSVLDRGLVYVMIVVTGDAARLLICLE